MTLNLFLTKELRIGFQKCYSEWKFFKCLPIFVLHKTTRTSTRLHEKQNRKILSIFFLNWSCEFLLLRISRLPPMKAFWWKKLEGILSALSTVFFENKFLHRIFRNVCSNRFGNISCTERTHREILLNQSGIRLYLSFSDCFGTKQTSVWFKFNRKMVNTI